MFQYRNHILPIEESMKNKRTFHTFAGLKKYLIKKYSHLGYTQGEITVHELGIGIDERNGWDNYVVRMNGHGVGFTDGPVGNIFKRMIWRLKNLKNKLNPQKEV